LQRALVADPNNKLALNLMRQIVDDPATLGRESFSYTVLPNDTMSTIAGRFLGDIYNFYILARYNKIAVPRQVAGGQVLRIPGKAPPPSLREAPRAEAPAPPPPSPAVRPNPAPPVVVARVTPPPPEPTPGERAMRAGETAERGGSVERALDEYRRAADLQQPGAQAKAEQLRKQLVQRYSLSARTSLARQDLEEAIRGWDRVLNIDPGNDIAKVERQRAMVLKQKLQGLGEAAPRAGRETASAP
jgi:tetratricopeptide (TPR) repeat protein